MRVALEPPANADWQAVRALLPRDAIVLARNGVRVPLPHVVSRYAPDEPLDGDAAITFNSKGEPTMKAHNFLWFDLETTGLDPRRGVPLEFAAVLCEDGAGDDFAIVAEHSAAIHWTQSDLDTHASIDSVVQRMHESNGLWGDVRESPVSADDCDLYLAAVAEELGTKRSGLRLAGFAPHFALAWVREFFPRFSYYCSHQAFDVLTLRRAAQLWAPNAQLAYEHPSNRALPDVHAAIAVARAARAALRGAP